MATIAEEINDLKSRVSSAYDACEAKGATIPTEKTTWNLSSTIETIPSGGGAQMPTVYGVPISAFLPIQRSDGFVTTPNDTRKYCLHIPGDKILLDGDNVISYFKRFFGSPFIRNSVASRNVYSSTPISSVVWEPNAVSCINSNNPIFLQNLFGDLFSGIEYDYVSFPLLNKPMQLYAGSYTTYGLKSSFQGSKIAKLDFPLYGGDKELCLSSIGLREFYAPMISSFGARFLAGNNYLSSCTLPRELKTNDVTQMLSGCSNLSALPIDCLSSIATTYSTSLEADRFAYGMTSLKDVDLSVNVGYINQYYSFVGSFSRCTSLSSATVRFSNTASNVLSCCANQVLSGMFEGCSNLKKAEIYGITHFGTPIGTNTSQGAKAIMSGTRSDSELWFPDLQVITGATGTTATYQKWASVGCKDLYFPKVSDIRNRYVFGGLGAETTGIHFAAANEAALKATTGWQYQWTAPATCTIYFDL